MKSQVVGEISAHVSRETGMKAIGDLSSPFLPGVQLLKLPENMSVPEGISTL
jgi:hypothetical protein